MKKQSFKFTLWAMAASFLLVLMMPLSTFAQRSAAADTGKRKAVNKRPITRQKAIKRNNTYRATKPSSATSRATRPTMTQRRAQTRAAAAKKANKRTYTATSRANRTRVVTPQRSNRPSQSTRYNNNRAQRPATAPAARVNRNNSTNANYCNNYYRNQNRWNRTFWTSINYTPSYYDLRYNRFNGFAERIWHEGRRYWFYDGIWFRKRFGRYYAVDAPIGIQVDSIPLGGDIIWYRGEKYVIYKGTAYRMLPFRGFEVVPMLVRFGG